jgi:hypothetical protein
MRTQRCLHSRWSFWLPVLTLLAAPQLAFGYGSGITGYSGLTAKTDCNTCHSGGPAPTVTISGPTTLAPGQVGKYTATAVVNAPGHTPFVGGIDIAVDDDQALLGADSPTTALRSGEVTHTQGLPYAKVTGQTQSLSIPFTLKAPDASGKVTIYLDMLAGAGQAAPTPDYGTLATLAVTVSKAGTTDTDGGTASSGGGADAGAGDGAGASADPAGGDPAASNGGMDNGGSNPGDPIGMSMRSSGHGCSVGAGSGAPAWPVVLLLAAWVLVGLRRWTVYRSR